MEDVARKHWVIRQEKRSAAPAVRFGRPQVRQLWDEPSILPRLRRFTKVIPFDGFLTNKLLTGLPGEELSKLLPHFEPVFLPTNHEVFETGEEIEFAYFPETAVISHVYYLEDGSTTGATIVGNEGMIGLTAVLNCRPQHWTLVTVGGTAVRIKAAIVKSEFVGGGAMQRLLLQYVNTRLAQLSQRAVCNGRHVLKSRFCTWLLMIHDRAKGRELPLTHEQIANQLGARRPGITSSCNALKDKGIIRYRRGLIEILDRERLEACACECYRALRNL